VARSRTRILHAGRHPARFDGAVNPPVYHASTIAFERLDDLEAAIADPSQGRHYGRFGTPTTRALEEAVADLEGGSGCVLAPSGLAAITLPLLALLGPGDHLLLPDSVYGPTRKFADTVLAPWGVAVEYYRPGPEDDLTPRLGPATRVVFTESPGSHTFEIQDIPAIARAAHGRGATVVMDNTWSAGWCFDALAHGVDVSVQAGTKYIVGHADALMGTVTARDPDLLATVRRTAHLFGHCAGSEEAHLALRGLRTLGVRLRQHQTNALAVARWLDARPEVDRVLFPAMPGAPGHDIWSRDFDAACGLFGVVLAQPYSETALAAMLDHMAVFGIGSSWGGYESLAIACHPERARAVTAWNAPGPVLRLHVGLEDPDDLIADLDAGFARLTAAG